MKKVGIGYEDYKNFIDENLYYVDKTLLIRDVLQRGGKVTLFTRPRRFGKTLTLSMLRTFFECEYGADAEKADRSRYFKGMKIMEAGEEVLSQMGQYPVINLSLKSAKQENFYAAFLKLIEEIGNEYRRHSYLLTSDKLSADEKNEYENILSSKVRIIKAAEALEYRELDDLAKRELPAFSTAIKALSVFLKKFYGKNVVVLIDEYDVPLENAYYKNYYDEMAGFIRTLFESALKTNDALQFAVITGCLRISRESIFTGMNNLKVVSIVNNDFAEGFGFTQHETEEMLAEYGLEDKTEEVRDWYNGYVFGNAQIYNPWSVVHYVADHISAHDTLPRPYWSNTSSNSVIEDLVTRASETVRNELDKLINGGSIEKRIHEDITYNDIYDSEENFWNFLFFTGYLKKTAERMEGEDILLTMCIPNREIRGIYRKNVEHWFSEKVKAAGKEQLYRAIRSKDTETIGSYITELLRMSISTFDSSEAFYHGFLVPVLSEMPDYRARSNREEGIGRPDIVLYPESPKDPVYIFELKARKRFNEMESGVREAFEQISDQHYEEGVLDDGYAGVVSYGICFCRKSCLVGLFGEG